MKTYQIPIRWECSTLVSIEAESLEEAIKKALQSENPVGKIDHSTMDFDFLEIDFHNRNLNEKDNEYIKSLSIY